MSHSNEKPTVLLVHGAWHNTSCWDATRAELKKLSYPTAVVPLKSSGNAVTTHLEDTAIIREALESLIVSEGKAVILVMHSYGGVAGTNAVHDLEAAARHEKGEKGGIIHCLFIAAFLVPKGNSLIGMFPEAPPYLYPDVGHCTDPMIVNYFTVLADHYHSPQILLFSWSKIPKMSFTTMFPRMSLKHGLHSSNLSRSQAFHLRLKRWRGRAGWYPARM